MASNGLGFSEGQFGGNPCLLKRCLFSLPSRLPTRPVAELEPPRATRALRTNGCRGQAAWMPVDLDALSPEERRARFRKREAQLRKKEEEEPELSDDFDMEQYKRFWTKK
ncbi:39S ribosomal protein L55, mitochondrial isoform X2 [Enhydra lutris kenyoni]|uniref:39S ribosomal protein L55, mitochondrial isoform X2 n=1 Tax=Enhydra lutris kenyoni TaxID=391180 RepID=A0A2Y9IJF8_ENHLU|nr:39S ribosomal protein L55, mitochondrial isoform X2 [Enhydra lutris kenyoni]